MSHVFAVDDKVKSKSGGSIMTIESFIGGDHSLVRCSWETNQAVFTVDSLQKYESGKAKIVPTTGL